MHHLTPDEVLAVLKAARVVSVRDWAAILIAFKHGMRASEVCGLRMADVDSRRNPSSCGGSKVR